MAGAEGMERRGKIIRYCPQNILQEILPDRGFIRKGRQSQPVGTLSTGGEGEVTWDKAEHRVGNWGASENKQPTYKNMGFHDQTPYIWSIFSFGVHET